MTSDTREILITNDDGIVADGIHVLASIMRRYGNVTVVAPLHAQSGKSAALSLDTKLYLKQIKNEPGYREYTFNGTPVDCIKIGSMSAGRRDVCPTWWSPASTTAPTAPLPPSTPVP